MNNRFQKFTSYILMFFVFFLNLSVPVFASDHSTLDIAETQNEYKNETFLISSSTTEHNHSHNTQIAVLSSNITSGEQIQVSFDDPAIENFTYAGNEVNVLNCAGGCISISLDPEIEFGTFEIVFHILTDALLPNPCTYTTDRENRLLVPFP